MMRILSIAWYKVLPPRFGGQKGITLFTKYLSKCIPLVLLCSKNNESSDDLPFQVLPLLPIGKSQFINPFCWYKIMRTAERNDATHLLLEHPYHGIGGYLTKKRTKAKLIIHSHNIESQRFKQLGKWWWWMMAKYEGWTHRRADLSLFKTEDDLEYAITHFKLCRNNCMVIPYGTEMKTIVTDKKNLRELICARHTISPGEKILLFAGTLDYAPNARAVEIIFKELAPRLVELNKFPFKIFICGRNKFPAYQYLKALKHNNIIYTGEVSDLERYLYAADVFINPLEQAFGIQTKIIDAVAHNLNVVTTVPATNGLPSYLLNTKMFVTENIDWAEFVKKINEALFTQSNTPQRFYSDFNWENIITGLCKKIKTEDWTNS